jgi:hypothetical protein
LRLSPRQGLQLRAACRYLERNRNEAWVREIKPWREAMQSA